MSRQKKIRRRPTTTAVVIGMLCFLLSASMIVSASILIFLFAKQYLNKTLLFILLSIVSLPLVYILFWLMLFFMETIEKIFGVRFRTKSRILKDE